MSPRELSHELMRVAPVLETTEAVAAAAGRILESGLPALPVVDEDGKLAGIFGEREVMAAVLPGYVGNLAHAAFVPKSLDAALEKRSACRNEPVAAHMNTERIRVGTDYSDIGLAETFLHHRVLIVPVCEGDRVVGVVTRADFFRALAERFLTG